MSTENNVSLGIFAQMEKMGHEQVIFNYDKATGLKAIIAIHDTTLGPALGGCRMHSYGSEVEAVTDALRLSRGMTYKCAANNVMHGGGKTVIIGDPQKDKSDEYFQALGTFVETLKGRFLTGTDMGTNSADFVSAAKQTKFVNGLPEEFGGSGNTAVTTAYGVWRALQATAKELFGVDSLQGLTIAVQGLGKVGCHLVKHLYEEGAIIVVSDIDETTVSKVVRDYPKINAVRPEEIYQVHCDIFSPNALGACINDATIPQLKCKAICGAANNVLAEPRHGDMLHAKEILYAPDYVVSAGGLIQVADELQGYNKDRAYHKTGQIYAVLQQIFAISRANKVPTYKAADLLAEKKIDTIGRVMQKYTG